MQNDRTSWLIAGGVILAGLVASPWLRMPDGAEEEQLRAQFHLPSDVDFAEIVRTRPANKNGGYGIEGVVRFDEAQYRRYRQMLTAGSSWAVPPLSLEGFAFRGTSANAAVRWEAPDRHRGVPLGNLSYDETQQVTQGLGLCYVLPARNAEQQPSEEIVPCGPREVQVERGYVVQGLLDSETRTLHVTIRRFGAWPLFD